MNLNKKIISLWVLIFVCLALALAGVCYLRYQIKIFETDSKNKISSGLITAKDREPLVVSPEAMQNGRVITLPILMYHHIGVLPENAGKIEADLTVPTANFEAQVKWLNQNGYVGISLEDIYLFSLGKFTMPKKPVVFTFDDGYQDALVNAPPILKKYGYAGSFAIITQKPGTAAGNNVYAPWQDISQAYNDGNEIVSHTQNHFDGKNPKFSPNYIYQNLNGSIADIKNNLGFTTNILVYPYGHCTDTYIAQAQKAGFVMGVTVHEGKLINLDNLMEIPRVRVHGAETLEEFEKIITK
jgi:peptidoglycan/xylan/chitin deacetylase (PgdA/CDA1 family)